MKPSSANVMNRANNNLSAQDVRNAMSLGADLGAKAGCLLSAAYTVVTSLFFLAVLGVLGIAPVFTFPVLFVYMLLLPPVLVLGVITGAVLAWLSIKFSGVVSKRNFLQISVLVCIIFLVVLHAIFFVLAPLVGEKDSSGESELDNPLAMQLDPLTSTQTYMLLIGFPSIIYVVSGVWISQKLWMGA